jgi:uncharacterized membrane protein HdeD (DUF308 family)
MVNEETPRPKLAGWLPMVSGVLAMVVGAVWTLQGLNVLTDSRMSDNRIWAVVGPLLAVAGLALIIIGVRMRSQAKR